MCKIENDVTIYYIDTSDGKYETVGRYFGSYSTSGLRKLGYKELCIPFQIPLQTAVDILNNLVDAILDGDLKIESDCRIHGQLKEGYDLKVFNFEDENTVYVMIPDENNLFPDEEGCNRIYYAQFYYAECIHDQHIVGRR